MKGSYHDQDSTPVSVSEIVQEVLGKYVLGFLCSFSLLPISVNTPGAD